MTDSYYPRIDTTIIPEGDYVIGDDDNPISKPAHTIHISAIAMGITAITNAQFRHFINAGGYATAAYWTDFGWRWQKNRQEQQPAFWEDRNFNHDLQPVVGVTWYEAVAFARWLAAVDGNQWRLPTEAEWEIAVRPGKDAQSIDKRHINSAEWRIGRTWAAIGRGQISWCGVRDGLGNVWEWTGSRWGRNWQSLDYRYPYDPADGREDDDGSHARVMRGGSWFDPVSAANPAHRGRYLPGSRGSNIGFRLAYSI